MSRQEEVGKLAFELRKQYPHIPFCEVADIAEFQLRRMKNPSESIGTETAEVYKQHLREQGDKYSLEMLDHLEKGTELSDDPSG